MEPFPHIYRVTTNGESAGEFLTQSPGLPDLTMAAPAEFDGPGDQWSPETLFVAAVASCYLLTFRSVARAARFEWRQLECAATGALDRIDRVTRFTTVELNVKLQVPPQSDLQKAQQLLEKAERACLITNSLNAQIVLKAEVYQ